MNAPDTRRLFVALALPDAIRAALQAAREELLTVLPPKRASWTKPEAMHLTLRFLGEVKTERIGELAECLRAAVSEFGELPLICERLGCFPELRSPRVVWVGVNGGEYPRFGIVDRNREPIVRTPKAGEDTGAPVPGAERLAELARRVDAAVAPFADKPAPAQFVGHITLARPRALHRAETEALARWIEDGAGRRFGSWTARELELICSELSPRGSRYTTLETCPFAPGPNP